MKPPTNIQNMLHNILVAIERIESHVRSAESPASVEDGIIFNLIVTGEAASKLPEDFKNSHKDIPWQDMIGMRHRLVHAYFTIDPRTVWDTVHNDLPVLKEKLTAILKQIEQ